MYWEKRKAKSIYEIAGANIEKSNGKAFTFIGASAEKTPEYTDLFKGPIFQASFLTNISSGQLSVYFI